LNRTVSILCAATKSHYHAMDGVEVYDARRNAWTFDGTTPVVGHPPCRAWSAFLAHQAKPTDREKELGIWVCQQLRRCGGVIEQPAHSRLFSEVGFPLPGAPAIDGVWTLAVQQWWFGYTIRKATWLAFSGVTIDQLPDLPYRLHDGQNDHRAFKAMGHRKRSETVKRFAQWLVSVARLTTIFEKAPF
jgi:hypothetical protein